MAAVSESCGSVCQDGTEADDQQLAFSGATSPDLVTATSRRPFRSSDGDATLNVEVFDAINGKDWPMLLFVHGICESAETWAVQRLASACLERRWRLLVLELEGHGLSSGRRAVCGDFDRLVRHVDEFVRRVAGGEGERAPFALCGTSLGGVLAAYCADRLVRSKEACCDRFLGVVTIAPAVGVDPRAVPSCVIVEALKVLAMVAPSAGVMTPVEDPSHYACPEDSMRNFRGHWPLATARMLLDVTSKRVRSDLASSLLAMEGVPALLVVAAMDDEVVPLEAVQDFYGAAKSIQKELVEIPRGGHGFLFEEVTSKDVIERIFKWLSACLDGSK